MLERMMGQLLKTKQQRVGNRVLHREGGLSTLGLLLLPIRRASIAVLGLIALPVFCAGLNDTGITYCANDGANGVACNTVAADNGSHPRQDGRFGRDPQNGASKLKKIGGGDAGFDYTKISNNGTAVAADALQGSNPGDWGCTRDNATGLLWEVKTTSGPHNQNDTFSWYSSDSTSNGGLAGSLNRGTCSISSCDTANFIAAVNFAGLCGATDWRLPTVKELQGLSDYGRTSPAIDPTYFPNTPVLQFWSSTASAVGGTGTAKYQAWVVDLIAGTAQRANKTSPKLVRLVRGL